VTAYGREEVLQQAEKFGLEGFLLKPISASMLFDTIMHAFGQEVPETSRLLGKQVKESDSLETIRGARILLVEDNEINQQVAKEILEGGGLNVTVTGDGQQAIHAVKESNFEAVLMDVQMPVMDGYTASREIRNLKSEIRNVPIIAMTAHAMAGDEQKSIEAAVEFGDVIKIKSIAEELKSESDRMESFSDELIRLADDFDFRWHSKNVARARRLKLD
jgi:CheY-like chemotaxis protein